MRFKSSFSSSARLSSKGGRAFATGQSSAPAEVVAPKVRRTPEELALRGTRSRIEGTFYVLAILMVCLAARLVWLQASAEEPKKLEKPVVLTAAPRRADILARDGTALAVTLDEYTIAANPRGIKEKEKMARLIAQAIGGDVQKYRALLDKTERGGKPNYYVRLAKRVSKERLDELKKLQSTKKLTKNAKRLRREFWAPISWEATPRRHYPLKNVACQLVGYTTPDGKGATGLEAAWNAELSGKPEEVVSQVDSYARPVPMFISDWKPSVQGRSIVTTIDRQIQAACDEALARMSKQYKPKLATAIVLDPRTGEVLAMSSAPAFDLNNPDMTTGALTSNRCLQYAYEPGSTFKIITAAAAVENVPNWQRYSFGCAGSQRVGAHNMHCWISSTSKRAHGSEDLSESIRDSCNFGVYGFARLSGRDTMLDYMKRFGLGQRMKMAQLRDHAGALPVPANPAKWGEAQFANIAFGQGMMLTPMQLARIAGVIANKGVMMKPLLIKETRDEKGNIIERFKPQVDNSTMPNGQIIKASTAEEVRKMMERVMTEGTARKFVFIPGYVAAGKTGSAQKAYNKKEDGRTGYSSSKFISSLVGFVPSKQPRFVILVMADEPRGSHWGSEVCGPAFADIATESMRLLRLREGANAPAPNPKLMVRKTD
jgi:cell division protein FtsI/penicillin-binding protein 2